MSAINRFLAASSLLFATGLPAAADTFTVDSSHSQVTFKVRHMGIAWVQGEFGDFAGQAEIENGELQSLSGTVQIASVDTDEPKRDAHLKSPDFFDAATWATMSFDSTKVKKGKAPGSYDVTGNLTIRGVTKPVTFQVSDLAKAVKDPWGGQRTGAVLTGTINRKDFGVSWNDTLDSGGLVVGDDVQIAINAELVGQPDS